MKTGIHCSNLTRPLHSRGPHTGWMILGADMVTIRGRNQSFAIIGNRVTGKAGGSRKSRHMRLGYIILMVGDGGLGRLGGPLLSLSRPLGPLVWVGLGAFGQGTWFNACQTSFKSIDFFPETVDDIGLADLEPVLVVAGVFTLGLQTSVAACAARLCSVTLGIRSALPTSSETSNNDAVHMSRVVITSLLSLSVPGISRTIAGADTWSWPIRSRRLVRGPSEAEGGGPAYMEMELHRERSELNGC
jgi:hypothetical protein